MGQGEILDFLEGRGWTTAKEIREELSTSYSVTSRILRVLHENSEIECDKDKKNFYGRNPIKYQASSPALNGS